MTDNEAVPNADALDELVAQLLDCGGPLSQIIGSMHEFEASGLSAPDAPPILQVAQSVIRGVVGDVSDCYSDEQIRVAAEIVERVTTAICENIFLVPPSEIRRSLHGTGSACSGRQRRQRRGRGRN